MVLVPGASIATTRELAERLRVCIQASEIQGIAVTASFGVAESSDDGLDFDALFATADEALYRAKAGGRNRVCTHEDPAFAVLT